MNKGFWKKLAAAAVTAAMLVSLAACSSAKKDAGADGSEDVKTFIDVLEDGSIVCYLDKTEKGTGGGSSITIEEGEYLVIDSEITDGSVHVKVTHGGDDINEAPVDNDTPATIDYVFEESGKTEYMEIEPGSYMINISVEKTASGKITFSKAALPEEDAAFYVYQYLGYLGPLMDQRFPFWSWPVYCSIPPMLYTSV